MVPPLISIEPATITDAASVLRLQKLAYRAEAELYHDRTLPPLTQTLAELEAEFATHLFLKAVTPEGTVIGSVCGAAREGTGYLGRLIVHPEWQGQGIGTRLLQAMEALLPSPRLELFTGHRSVDNLRLYERLGYRRCREQVVSPTLTLVFLERVRLPSPIYDTIGTSYSRSRRAEPRIVARLVELLDLPMGSVLADIGAGTGNYTNALAEQGFTVHAVEPSGVMRDQAAPHARVFWHAGRAEALPLPDASVAGIVSTLAPHHFTDREKALREMARVAGTGPVVLLTFDVRATNEGGVDGPLWLRDYFPTLYRNGDFSFPPLEEVAAMAASATGRKVRVLPFLLPPDSIDLFLAAGWQRPDLYLDPAVRAGISAFAVGDPAAIAEGLARLRADLDSGAWETRYGAIRQKATFDAGYRFLHALPACA